jgi:alanine dehydrogenase
MYAYPDQISKTTSYCDVLVGAVAMVGERAPHLVTETMVKGMRPGSVIIDVSIDQGGCVETSRPTTLRDPTYEMHGVIHFCVPNFTARIARTASRSLSNVLRPYITTAARGREQLLSDSELRSALVIYDGKVVDERLSHIHNVPHIAVEEIA